MEFKTGRSRRVRNGGSHWEEVVILQNSSTGVRSLQSAHHMSTSAWPKAKSSHTIWSWRRWLLTIKKWLSSFEIE